MTGTKWLTYKQLGERLGIKTESARQKALRAKWPKRTNNAGRVEVEIDTAAPWYSEALLSASNNAPRDKPATSPLQDQLFEALQERDKAISEAAQLRHELAEEKTARVIAETQATERAAHIETLKNPPRRRWFWSR